MRKYTLEERISAFWSHVNKSAGDSACWPWQASVNKAGYGWFRWEHRSQLAHRLAYAITFGEIPEGMYICHRCDNPPCCNPDHLWLGTHADNQRDKVAKGRQSRISGDNHWTHTNPEKVWRIHPKADPNAIRKPRHFLRGEANVRAKLTEEQVLEIRALFATGSFSQRQLAKQFSIDRTVISGIIHRRYWKHI